MFVVSTVLLCHCCINLLGFFLCVTTTRRKFVQLRFYEARWLQTTKLEPWIGSLNTNMSADSYIVQERIQYCAEIKKKLACLHGKEKGEEIHMLFTLQLNISSTIVDPIFRQCSYKQYQALKRDTYISSAPYQMSVCIQLVW